MKANVQNILTYLNGQKGFMEAFLKGLVEVESPSHDANAQEPLFRILTDKMTSLGYSCRRFPGNNTGGFLTASPQSRKKKSPIQLLIGHCDTVWSKGTINTMPIKSHNGKLMGPGIFDMKAGITQIVWAIKTIKTLNLPLSLMPFCIFNSDEEIGSRESTSAIRRLAKIAQRAYILEPPLGLSGDLKTARKGLGRFTIKVKGTAAHAGLNPGEGYSAILELSHQIQKLFSFNDIERGITVNVGMIEGGISPNVVAPQSTAVADVRALTSTDAEEVAKKIFGLKPVDSNVTLEIDGGFGRPPMERTARNVKLWSSAKEAAKLMNLELNDATAGGGSDANTTSLFTATLDGLGTTGDGAHASHEFIYKEKLKERTALLVLLMMLPIKK